MSFQNTLFNQSVLTAYPSVNLNYSINNHWELFASMNTSSRLPSFTELYYKDAVHNPNPSLKQEKSKSFEFGIKNLNRIAITNLNAYYMQGKDMIDWVKINADDEKWECRNLNELNKYGFDIDSKIFLAEIFPTLNCQTVLQLSYSYISQKQGDIDYISQYVLNYLNHKATARLSFPVIRNLTLNIAAKYCKRKCSYIEYKDLIVGEEKEFDPFIVVDCNVNYKYKKFDFYINCSNITNQEYFDIGNIPQPQRWFIGGFKFEL